MGDEKVKYRRELWKLFEAPGPAAEIGVAEGNNSHDMLLWKIGGRFAVTKLYMVDRWKETPSQKGDAAMPQEWHDNNLFQATEKIRPFKKRAVLLRGDSIAMAQKVRDESLNLLYIDGDHSYEGVMADLTVWTPKVKTGGIVALHDYLSPAYGVKKAVTEYCGNDWEVHLIPEDKPEDAGCWFRVM